MPGSPFDPEVIAAIPEVASYAIAAAGVSLGGLAWIAERRRFTAEERARISEERRRLDAKTGLLNYPAFQEEFASRTGNTHRAGDIGRQHGLLLADIDDFKALNTRLTHPTTDKVALLPVAEVLKHTMRPDSDVVGKFGGEEFVALLSNTDQEGALTVCQNIQDHVNAIHPDPSSPDRPLGLTIAYTTFAQGTPLEGLMKTLSAELTLAKGIPGKNQIVQPQPVSA